MRTSETMQSNRCPPSIAARKSCRGRKAGRFNILTGEIEAQRVEHRLIVVNDRDVNESAHAWAVFAMGSVK